MSETILYKDGKKYKQICKLTFDEQNNPKTIEVISREEIVEKKDMLEQRVQTLESLVSHMNSELQEIKEAIIDAKKA